MFEFLKKRYVTISLIISGDNVFMLLNFKKYRTKFLKGQRMFYARVLFSGLSFEEFCVQIREWAETVTEDYLLERLENSPNNSRPIFYVTPKLKFDFNVVEEEVTTLLLPLSSS